MYADSESNTLPISFLVRPVESAKAVYTSVFVAAFGLSLMDAPSAGTEDDVDTTQTTFSFDKIRCRGTNCQSYCAKNHGFFQVFPADASRPTPHRPVGSLPVRWRKTTARSRRRRFRRCR